MIAINLSLSAPPLAPRSTVVVRAAVRVIGTRGEPRTLRAGDRLTVESHDRHSPTAVCVQEDSCRRRVHVPVACLRVVRGPADGTGGDDGDSPGGGPVG